MQIRKAREKDLTKIITIWKRNIKTINTAADISDLFYTLKKYFFVAASTETFTEKLVGFVGGRIRMNHGHISGIAIDREYRRRGIGKMLLETVEKEFMQEGFDKVTLEVRKSNMNAIRFYEKQGYTQSYIVKGYYADGEDAIVYEHIL